MELAILVSNLFIHVHEFIFIRPFEKNGTYFGNKCGGQRICLLNNF